ncbi:hypothetical protein Lal_00010874 [Lupinus albus]|nr:hypothetical protein Lal_00010874 [Lupinus albus]
MSRKSSYRYCFKKIKINAKHDIYEIRKIYGTHTFVSINISQDHMKLNSLSITNCIFQLVYEDLNIPIKSLMKEVVIHFGYMYYVSDTIGRYAESRHEDHSSLILDRVFWAFKSCIEGFGFCRPILQVEGTLLTGKYT